MTTEILHSVPAGEYFSLHGTNISRLKEMRRSPQHYLYHLSHPRETQPMRLGTAAHMAVLEPKRFRKEYAVWSTHTNTGRLAQRRGKEWEAFCALHEGMVIITEAEYEVATEMAIAVHANRIAGMYLCSGSPEVVMQWKLPGRQWLSGRQCKGRVDFLAEPHVVVGLKTARDCRKFHFGVQAARLGYHLQWAWYYDGYLAITGHEPKMVEIVVESAPPHAVAVYTIPSDIILRGREEYQFLLKRLDECEIIDHFPGPQEEEIQMELLYWAYSGEEV